MTKPQVEFPALYHSANQASVDAQNAFWWTIRAEYILLFFVAVLSSTRDLFGLSPIVITLLLVILGGLFVFKVYKKLDQDWYRCRALAESVKTSTWRFAMRSHPFNDAFNIEQPKAEFRNLLRDILKANRHLGEKLQNVETEQVTASMLAIRELPLEERLAHYVENRIDDQRKWYSQKSSANRKALRIWIVATVAIYVLAAISLNSNDLGFGWAKYGFDPLVVVVTSAIGWVQMKRHSELMASYNLTAHEIGIIRGNSDAISSEEDLSDFVNEAELAFSREHTQWVARRDAN